MSHTAIIQTTVSRPESVRAAIQNGADEIVFSKKFPSDKLSESVGYCRVRGINTLLDYSGYYSDKALEQAYNRLTQATGANAVIFTDLGILRICRASAPWLSFHYAKTARGIYDAAMAKKLGCERIRLSISLNDDEIRAITAIMDAEIDVISPFCACSDVQACFLGAHNNSAPNGCQKACHKEYSFGSKADGRPMQFKDNCLLRYCGKLKRLGVKVMRVVPSGSSAEESALLTHIAQIAINGTAPSKTDLSLVAKTLNRPGYSDFFYKGKEGIFECEPNGGDNAQELLEITRMSYTCAPERQCIPVRFYALVPCSGPAKLAVADADGNTAATEGIGGAASAVQRGGEIRLEAEVNTQWYKTSGTYYRCEEAKTQLESGAHISHQTAQSMRKDALKKLEAKRADISMRKLMAYNAGAIDLPRSEQPLINIQVLSFRQISPELLELKPSILYFPLEEIPENTDKVLSAIKRGIIPAAALPRIIEDMAHTKALLGFAHEIGIRQLLVHNISHQELAHEYSMDVRANISSSNSQELKELKRMGFISAVISPALNHTEIKELSHRLDTEVVLYGRLPMLYSEICLISRCNGMCCCDNNNTLVNSDGERMPVLREGRHSNQIYHAGKLWYADELKRFSHIGIWAVRLSFTTENALECIQVTERYKGMGRYRPNLITKGFY